MSTRTSVQTFTPTTGTTVAPVAVHEDIRAIITPAGTLSTLTFTLPIASSDGQHVSLSSSATVTTLTLNSAAGSVVGALTTIGVGGFANYVWSAVKTKWYRCG
jgi:hypothetical protein